MSTNTATLLLLLMAIAALGKQIPAHQHDRLHTLSSMQQHTEDLKHEGPTRNLQTVTRAAMRMTMNTSNLGTAIAPTTTATLSFITNIMLVIKQFVKLRFQVYSEQANIVAPATCVDYTSPSVDVSSGIANSDLHLYVLYQSNSSSTSVATGKYCQVTSGGGSLPDATLARGRPTFGRIRFNTAPTLDGATLTNRLFADTASYALHEVFHIMGFDSSLYSTYIDASTQTTYISAVLQTATGMHSSRSATKWITTPKVLAWAKDWFGCSSIGGMPVENEGSDGEQTEWATSYGSHWDRTLMYDELMTRDALGSQRGISGLTFALFSDMGWYTVDATFNDTSPYGYKKGCDFFNLGCNSSTTYTEFCTAGLNVKSCTSQSLSKSTCQTNAYSDKCGIWKGTLNCVDPDAASDGYKNLCQQTYGTSSFCVSSTIATVSVDNTLQSRCYPYTCHDNNNITFLIGANPIYCAPVDAGKTKALAGYYGTLTCPTYQDFCRNSRKICPNWCSQKGICTRGVCNCMDGAYGADCSQSTSCGVHYYDPSTSSCQPSCPTEYFINVFSGSCQICVNCTQCAKEPTVCSACIGGEQKQYQNVCYDQCPSSTYAVGDLCYACSTSCGNCSAASSSSCTSCPSTLYLSNPTMGTCALTCPDSNYLIFDTVNMKCVNNCPSNLYLDNGQCLPCAAGTYKNSTGNVCVTTCPDGSYANTTLGACSTCDTMCATCNGGSKISCVSCPTSGTTYNYFLLGMCVASNSCPLGTYADSTTHICTSCPATVQYNCSTCHNDTGVILCSTCKYGTFMTLSGTCSGSCASNQFPNLANSSCVNCDSSCATCYSQTNNSCMTCDSSKFLLTNSSGGYCLASCPLTLYWSQYTTHGLCLPCYATCLTCSGSLRSSTYLIYVDCITCVSGMYSSGGVCYYACPLGTYRNSTNSVCSPCDAKCIACKGSGDSNCTKCASGYVLDNTTCTSTCPTGQSANSYGACTWVARITVCFFAVLVTILTL